MPHGWINIRPLKVHKSSSIVTGMLNQVAFRWIMSVEQAARGRRFIGGKISATFA